MLDFLSAISHIFLTMDANHIWKQLGAAEIYLK